MNIKDFFKRNKYLIFILFAAILLRAFFFAAILHNFGDRGFYPRNSDDTEQYLQLAKNLVKYNVFSMSDSPPFENQSFRTPGYPVFISFFYKIIPAVWFVIIFQNLIALAIVLLIYGLAILLFQRKIIALLASLIYAIEPAVIYWNNQLLSETLFTFLILFCVFIFIRNICVYKKYILPTALALGAVISLIGYTKPIAQYLLIIFILFCLIFFTLKIKNFFQCVLFILLMVASFSILSAPWLIRNKVLIGSYDFSSVSNNIGFLRQLDMMYRNTGGNLEDLNKIKKDEAKVAAIKYIAKHPLAFVKINLLSSIPFLMGDSYFTAATVIYPPLEKQRIFAF